MTTAFILMMAAAGCFCISASMCICLAYRQGRHDQWEDTLCRLDDMHQRG